MVLQKLRDPDTLSGVIAEFIETLTARRCAELAGCACSMIYKYADPDQEIELSDVRILLRLDLACDGASGRRPFLAWVANQAPDDNGADTASIELEAMEATGAHGEVIALIREARRPDGPGGHAITEHERMAIIGKVRHAQAEHGDIVTALNLEVCGSRCHA